MCYTHQMVVHDVRQVVGRQFVGGLVQHLVVQDVRVDCHIAANQVMHHYILVGLYQKPHHKRLTVQKTFFRLRAGQRVVHHISRRGIVLEVRYLLTLGFQLLRRVKRQVSLVLVQQLLHILPIDIPALALSVRTVLAYAFYLAFGIHPQAFVNLYPEPAQRLQYILFCARHEACRVGIFYSQEHIAVMLAGEQVVVQCRTHAAYMQRTRRRRSKTHSYFSCIHSLIIIYRFIILNFDFLISNFQKRCILSPRG